MEDMKNKGLRVSGIGHRIKSKDNIDSRVVLLSNYARRYFPATKCAAAMGPAVCIQFAIAHARFRHLSNLPMGYRFGLAAAVCISWVCVRRYLDYAKRVEQYTLQKAANLVLNVDGCIGALFLDLLHSSSMFTEVDMLIHLL